MLHGRQASSTCMAFSAGWFHPIKPAYGCVAPQMLTTGVAVSDAMCMLEESIDTMTSKWLISINS